MLTIERAIADALDPASLRWVADSNEKNATKARHGSTAVIDHRLARQAQNLRRIADKLELLGYGRRAA